MNSPRFKLSTVSISTAWISLTPLPMHTSGNGLRKLFRVFRDESKWFKPSMSWLNTFSAMSSLSLQDPLPHLSLHCKDREFPSYFDVVPYVARQKKLHSYRFLTDGLVQMFYMSNIKKIGLNLGPCIARSLFHFFIEFLDLWPPPLPDSRISRKSKYPEYPKIQNVQKIQTIQKIQNI